MLVIIVTPFRVSLRSLSTASYLDQITWHFEWSAPTHSFLYLYTQSITATPQSNMTKTEIKLPGKSVNSSSFPKGDTIKQSHKNKNKSGLRLPGKAGRIRRHAAKRFMPRQTDISSKNCRPIMVVLRNGKVRVVDPKRVFSDHSSSTSSRPSKRARYREEDSSSLSSGASNTENEQNNSEKQIMPPPSLKTAADTVKSLPISAPNVAHNKKQNAFASAAANSKASTPPAPVEATAAKTTAEPSLTKVLPSTAAAAAATTPKRSNIPKQKPHPQPKGNKRPPSPPSPSGDDEVPLPTKTSKRIRSLKERKAKAMEEKQETKRFAAPAKQEQPPAAKQEKTKATKEDKPQATKKAVATKAKPVEKPAAIAETPTPFKAKLLSVSPPKRGKNKPRVPVYSTTSTYRVKEPTENDVIFGRGNGVACHVGNVKFRSYIWDARERYAEADRNDKNLVAESVCEMVTAGGGKFLVKEPNGEYWVEANERKALEKACQALREQKWNPDNKPVLPSEEPEKPKKEKPKKKKKLPKKEKEKVVKKTKKMSAKTKVPKSTPKAKAPKPSPKAKAPKQASTTAPTPPASKSTASSSDSAVVSVGSTPVRATPSHELLFDLSVSANGSDSNTNGSSAITSNILDVPSHLRNGSSPSPPPKQEVSPSSVDSVVSRKPVALEVGTRLSVYWPLDKAYYDATVRKRKGSVHFIEYNADGVTEWLDLSRQTFKIISVPASLKWFPDDEQW